MNGRNEVSIGHIGGIRIGLDYSWFLVFALMTWLLAASYFPSEFHDWSPATYWAMGAVTALALFGSVLLHELGHSFVARRFNVPVSSITLFIFGGVSKIGSEPPSVRAELLIALAGPVVSLLLALFFALMKPLVASVEPALGFVEYLAYINFALAVFNLFPGFPLDGGRVLRAILWGTTGSMQRATRIAANVGRFFGLLLILLGVWQALAGNLGGLWIAFIGWFLDSAASAQGRQAVLRDAISGHTVAQAMRSQVPSVQADTTVQQLVDDRVLGGGQRCFLVTRGSETVGMITLHAIKSVPRARWPGTTAGEAMIPLEKLKRLNGDTELWPALELMDRNGVNQLPVMNGSLVVGLLGREDVIAYLRALHELGG